MTRAFYNENDPFCGGWLRNLVTAGHIAPGVVDGRSIQDLTAADVAGPGQRHFFAGLAGWSHALRLAGVPDDADVWSGSCPCQSFSNAGGHAPPDGFADPRHLWPAWWKLIDQCRPPLIFGEQVANRAGFAWFDAVCANLEGAGYAVAAADLPAASTGAPHIRQRLWFVATRGLGDASRYRDRQHTRELPRDESEHEVRPTDGRDPSFDPGTTRGFWKDAEWLDCLDGVSRPAQSKTHPVAARLPGDMGRIRAYGNSINTETAASFIRAALDAILG